MSTHVPTPLDEERLGVIRSRLKIFAEVDDYTPQTWDIGDVRGLLATIDARDAEIERLRETATGLRESLGALLTYPSAASRGLLETMHNEVMSTAWLDAVRSRTP